MGTATPTIDLPRSKVRTICPDKETGEIIERVIPVKSLRPKPPRRPVVDEALVARLPRARAVLYMFAHREAEIAFWQFHDHILTKQERHDFLHEDARSVLRPLPAAWKPGDRMFVASNVEAEVVETTESPRGYGTVFNVHDYRVLYLRRGVLGDTKPKTDEDGYAAPLTPAEKERARLDGAYTTSASQAVDEAGGVMEEEAYERIHREKDAADSIAQSKGRVQVTEGRLLRRLADAEASNRRSTVRHLKRELSRLHAKAS